MSEIAFIREDECIGCTKCIQACPVDAIIGAAKQMHTVITDECIGCELCVAPCPVDCIDMLTVPTPSKEERKERADHAKKRVHARKQRLAEIHKHTAQLSKVKISTRKAEILAAVKRVIKKHDT